jgi:hypothetical protein
MGRNSASVERCLCLLWMNTAVSPTPAHCILLSFGGKNCMKIRAALLAISVLIPPVLSAQTWQSAVSGAVGVLHTNDEGTGVSLTGSYLIGNSYLSLALTPVDLGVMTQDPNGRYQTETLSNGNTVCRDHTNGQFASESNCGPRILYAASADVLAALMSGNGNEVGLGGGYRVGNSAGPYGLASLHFGPLHGRNWHLRARVGASFFDAVIGAALPLNISSPPGH